MGCDFYLPPMPNSGKFIGCDGKVWDDDFIKYHLDKAIDEENYEWAKECKEELDRRNRRKQKNRR